MTPADQTLYEILGIKPQATHEEIKDAYRVQAMKWHPDRNLNNRADAEARFKNISNAYRILSDYEKRAAYDAGLAAQGAPGGGQKRDFGASGSGASGDDASMFFDQMLDLATEIAARGYDEDQIVKALAAFDCPEGIARIVASKAAKGARNGKEPRPETAARETPPQNDIAATPWDEVAPYYEKGIGSSDAVRMNDVDYTKRLSAYRIQLGIYLATSILFGLISGDPFAIENHPYALGALMVIDACILVWFLRTYTKAFRREHSRRYYLPIFQSYHQADEQLSFWRRWNFWAGFLWIFWLAYRGMPAYVLLSLVPLGFIGFASASMLSGNMVLSSLAAWSVVGILGAMANPIYFSAVKKRISQHWHLPKRQALDAIEQQSKPRSRAWIWAGVLLCIAYAPATNLTLQAQQQKSAAIQEQQRVSQQAEIDRRLDAVIARVESTPELNHKSADYDQRAVNYVLENQKRLIAAGKPPDEALQSAYEGYLAARRSQGR